MDKRVAHQNNTALMHQHRDTDRAILGGGVKNMVDQAQNMRGFSRGPCDQTIPVPMCKHQSREHMTIPRGQTMDVMPIKAFTLQAVIKKIFISI